MEGMGSRPGRTSSRYGSAPSPGPPPPPLFNGPVRKWKKQWVSYESKGDLAGKRNRAPPLILCRWTPVPATDEEPRKRRIRYTPVTPTQKKNTGTPERDEAKESNNLQPSSSAISFEKPSYVDISTEEAQEEMCNWF